MAISNIYNPGRQRCLFLGSTTVAGFVVPITVANPVSRHLQCSRRGRAEFGVVTDVNTV